jgi:hypothetical protein
LHAPPSHGQPSSPGTQSEESCVVADAVPTLVVSAPLVSTGIVVAVAVVVSASVPSVADPSPPTPDESNAHASVPTRPTHASNDRDIEYDP